MKMKTMQIAIFGVSLKEVDANHYTVLDHKETKEATEGYIRGMLNDEF